MSMRNRQKLPIVMTLYRPIGLTIQSAAILNQGQLFDVKAQSCVTMDDATMTSCGRVPSSPQVTPPTVSAESSSVAAATSGNT